MFQLTDVVLSLVCGAPFSLTLENWLSLLQSSFLQDVIGHKSK